MTEQVFWRSCHQPMSMQVQPTGKRSFFWKTPLRNKRVFWLMALSTKLLCKKTILRGRCNYDKFIFFLKYFILLKNITEEKFSHIPVSFFLSWMTWWNEFPCAITTWHGAGLQPDLSGRSSLLTDTRELALTLATNSLSLLAACRWIFWKLFRAAEKSFNKRSRCIFLCL